MIFKKKTVAKSKYSKERINSRASAKCERKIMVTMAFLRQNMLK